MVSSFMPNGLLPNEANSVNQVLDQDRWSQAEERTAELIAHIQPNQPSEEHRNAVASYVKRLIMKCFSCEAFTFGSLPLKTYLPDGDIDLTALSSSQNFKDSWAHKVRDILESEEKSEDAEFRVKEVQCIQAEVMIIKCLVENIVVDISFNQLGGLCTLCFLEEVDNLINRNHIFKRSIILIKGNLFRIRKAFALGAQQLVRLLDCPEENLISEFDLFFRNTWDRHEKGHRPDAPSYDLYARNKNVVENSTCHVPEDEHAQASHASHYAYLKHANHLIEAKEMFGTSFLSAVLQTQLND